MYCVYVLYSETYNKTYVGYSSDLESRIESHNEYATKGWTIKYRPWKLLFHEEYSTKAEAMKREKALKAGKGRDYIKKILSEYNSK